MADEETVPTRQYDVDIVNADAELLLIKVPNNVYELICNASAGADLGTVTKTKGKTTRLELNGELLPSESRETAIKRYKMSDSGFDGYRVIQLEAPFNQIEPKYDSQSVVFRGVITESTIASADPSDPKYKASMRQASLAAQKKRQSRLGKKMEKVDLAAVSRMREAKQQAAPIAEPVEAIVNPLLASEDISSGRAKKKRHYDVVTIFELRSSFSKAEIQELCAKRYKTRKELDDEIKTHCDFHKSGTFRNRYTLKQEYRTYMSVPLETDSETSAAKK